MSNATTELIPGYIVSSKVSNTPMTVDHITGQHLVVCYWFDEETLRKSEFQSGALNLVSPPKIKFPVYKGDRVQLQSGGPILTVESTEPGHIICQWKNSNGNFYKKFNSAALSKID